MIWIRFRNKGDGGFLVGKIENVKLQPTKVHGLALEEEKKNSRST